MLANISKLRQPTLFSLSLSTSVIIYTNTRVYWIQRWNSSFIWNTKVKTNKFKMHFVSRLACWLTMPLASPMDSHWGACANCSSKTAVWTHKNSSETNKPPKHLQNTHLSMTAASKEAVRKISEGDERVHVQMDGWVASDYIGCCSSCEQHISSTDLLLKPTGVALSLFLLRHFISHGASCCFTCILQNAACLQSSYYENTCFRWNKEIECN